MTTLSASPSVQEITDFAANLQSLGKDAFAKGLIDQPTLDSINGLADTELHNAISAETAIADNDATLLATAQANLKVAQDALASVTSEDAADQQIITDLQAKVAALEPVVATAVTTVATASSDASASASTGATDPNASASGAASDTSSTDPNASASGAASDTSSTASTAGTSSTESAAPAEPTYQGLTKEQLAESTPDELKTICDDKKIPYDATSAATITDPAALLDLYTTAIISFGADAPAGS
jgi:hypothetical protein